MNIFAPANEVQGKVSAMPKGETIASLINQMRSDNPDLTYQQIADASGGRISPNYVYNLAKGAPTRRLGADIIVGLARGLNKSPLYIFQLAAGLAPQAKDDPLHQTVDSYYDLQKQDRDELRLMWEILKKEVAERSLRPS